MARMLAAILLVAMLVASVGSAETVILRRDDTAAILALWVRDGAAYLFTRDGYSFLPSGNAAPEERVFELPLQDGEFLLALAPGDAALWAILLGRDESARLAKVSLDADGGASLGAREAFGWAELLDADDLSIASPYVQGENLAFITYAGTEIGAVAAYNLSTGEGELHDADRDGYRIDARAICPYKDGMGLIASIAAGQGVTLYTLDFAAGTVESALALSVADPYSFCALGYDASSDTVTYVADGRLWSMAGLDPKTATALAEVTAIEPPDAHTARMDDGTILIAGRNTALLYRAEQNPPKADRLSIAADDNQFMNDAYYAYLDANPGAAISISNRELKRGDISQAILTQSAAYDIYVTRLDWPDYIALYKKDYLPSLSASAELTAFAARMYPAMRAAIEQDGALVAFPIEYQAYAPAYNPTAFERLGLTDADAPTNWPDFLRLLQRLPTILEGTDITAFHPRYSASNVKNGVYDMIFKYYNLYLESDPSAEMKYDTEILRTLLAEYEKIDFSGLAAEEDWAVRDEMRAEQYALFSLEELASCEADESEYIRYMPLALAEGMEPMVFGSMIVAIANPHSKHKEAAIRFLEAAARMSGVIPANVCADWAEPVKDESAEAVLAHNAQRIAEVEAEMAKATGDEKQKYQEMLGSMRENYANMEASMWPVSLEKLARYQAYAPYVRVWRYFGVDTGGGGEYGALMGQYRDGLIDAETLLKNMDKKIIMMLLEE